LTCEATLLDCPNTAAGRLRGRRFAEAVLFDLDGQDRRKVAVVVTADGRRVQMPVDSGLDVALRSLYDSLRLGLEGLLGLITGSRRDRGTRDERR
jgi:hypothetical protein